MSGAAPIDYKVWTFYGDIGVIEAKAHPREAAAQNQGAWHVFDAAWRPLGNVFHEYRADPSIPPPVHAAEMLEMARRISASIPRPYLRVDLYEDARGPVFGEITPEPGGEMLTRPNVDRQLGILWERAEAKLRVRSSADGSLDPADGPEPEASLTFT